MPTRSLYKAPDWRLFTVTLTPGILFQDSRISGATSLTQAVSVVRSSNSRLVTPACFSRSSALDGIEAVDVLGLDVVRVAFLEVGRGGLGVAEQGLLDDGFLVHAVVERLTDQLVVERGLGAVEHEEQQAEGLDGFNLDLGLQAVDVQVGNVFDGLDAAGLDWR